MLNPKPWQLTGEIEGQKRPENSLLEEYLQYERTTRLGMFEISITLHSSPSSSSGNHN